ncbi:MAG TPA: hypothetical protein VKV17_08265 [Bryobacteraceae bacterium]|nr:hypothetical protein [Bryobacteraceae bacterium]
MSSRNAGINSQDLSVIALAPDGSVYAGGFPACAAPTLQLGNATQESFCVTKTNPAGNPVFSVQIGGVSVVDALITGATGNAYIAGFSYPGGMGFATTPGAYEPSPPDGPASFVCALSATDGHPLFCTFVDVSFLNAPFPPLAVDSTGAAYIAGNCASASTDTCVQKISADGTAAVYLTHTGLAVVSNVYPYAALDGQGDLFVAQPNGMVKLGPSGTVIATTALEYDQLLGLALDPAGEPEIAVPITPGQTSANLLLRRFQADLSADVFDTQLFLPATVYGLAVDSAGISYLWGQTNNVNLPAVHPTAVCRAGSNVFLARLDNNGAILQSTFVNTSSGILAGTPLYFDSKGASLLVAASTTVGIVGLGPANSEVVVSCAGSGASFSNAPIAPNQLISLFGYGIGPTAPLSGEPDSNGLYPFQLGGAQVTFDGIAAPLLYAGGGQINLVTPGALQGKTTTHICAVVNNAATNCLNLPVQPASPDVFLLSGNQPAAYNQDGTVNTSQNAAPAGTVVSLYLTGLGATSPATPDGAVSQAAPPAPAFQVQVVFTWQTQCSLRMSSESVTVNPLYAGPAPLEVEGLSQIDVAVPSPPPPTPPNDCSPVPGNGGPMVAIQVLVPGAAAPVSSQPVQLWTD